MGLVMSDLKLKIMVFSSKDGANQIMIDNGNKENTIHFFSRNADRIADRCHEEVVKCLKIKDLKK